MKNRIRILGFILLLTLIFTSAAACASTPSDETTKPSATSESAAEPGSSASSTETPVDPTTAETPVTPTPTETPVLPTIDTPTQVFPTIITPTPTETPVTPTPTETPVTPTPTETPVTPTPTETPVTPTPTETPVTPTPTETPAPVAVTGVSLSKTDVVVKEGETVKLTAEVLPENADNKDVEWSSADESIATVKNGVITGVKSGETTVTVKTKDGGFSAVANVAVSTDRIPVTKMYFAEEEVFLYAYETCYLTLCFEPKTAYTDVQYYSYNRSIALVNESGKVTGISEGTATIIATARIGETEYLNATCQVTVGPKQIPVMGIVLRTKTLDLRVGQTGAPKVVILPSNATNQKLIYESSAPNIVSVKGETLIGVTEGTAVVTVRSEDGGYSAQLTVTVKGSSEEMDMLDYSQAQAIRDKNGYSGGIRKKTTGEILFSPNLPELRNMDGFYDNYDDYLAYIRFSYTDEGDDNGGYTFPSFTLAPKKSKGDWVDFFLQGDGIDCGFCPVAGVEYNISIALVNVNEPNVVVIYGTYTFSADEEITESPYYRPTYGPGRQPGEFYIRYIVSGHGRIEGETTQLVSGDKPSTRVVAIPDSGYIFVMWSDGVKTAERSGDIALFDKKITAYFSTDATNTGIAQMYIITESGTPIRSKNYENAVMTIVGASEDKYNLDEVTLQIRGRGNSSWNGGAGQNEYDSKNSYRIKFDEKVKLLGIGDSKNRDWVLNSNKFDLSGLRNYLVWTLANKMGTFPYVPSCDWVQLYINGQYRGMYMVTELIEVGNDRVEVDDKIEGTDKGFLIEFDFRGNNDDEPYFYLPGYGPDPSYNRSSAVELCIKSNITYTTDARGNKIYDQSEIEGIKQFMLKCNEAVFSGKREEMEKYIDIPSFIDMYIIEELTKDCDAGRASFFVQRDAGGKLYCTAPWDFDFGFGTYGPATNYWGLASDGDEICPWYGFLVGEEWFREEVLARMEELNVPLTETLEEIDRKAAFLKDAADANAYFWNMYGRSFHAYVSSQVSRNLDTYEEHINFIKDWTLNRWDCLIEALEDY